MLPEIARQSPRLHRPELWCSGPPTLRVIVSDPAGSALTTPHTRRGNSLPGRYAWIPKTAPDILQCVVLTSDLPTLEGLLNRPISQRRLHDGTLRPVIANPCPGLKDRGGCVTLMLLVMPLFSHTLIQMSTLFPNFVRRRIQIAFI